MAQGRSALETATVLRMLEGAPLYLYTTTGHHPRVFKESNEQIPKCTRLSGSGACVTAAPQQQSLLLTAESLTHVKPDRPFKRSTSTF